MTKKDIRVKNQAQLVVYNQLQPKIGKWLHIYWKAIKECWNTPYRCHSDMIDILIKHKLGSSHTNYLSPKDNISWDYDLRQLDNQVKLK